MELAQSLCNTIGRLERIEKDLEAVRLRLKASKRSLEMVIGKLKNDH